MSKSTSPTPFGNHHLNIGFAVIGLLINIAGTLTTSLPSQKLSYLIGGSFLLLSTLLERQLFFTLLQIVINSGTIIAFAPISPFYKALVPITLSIIVLVYLIKNRMLKDPINQLGCLGLIFLAIGYAITHPLIYFLGGICLAVFSFAAFKQGVRFGLISGILNTVFTITAGIATYKLFFL